MKISALTLILILLSTYFFSSTQTSTHSHKPLRDTVIKLNKQYSFILHKEIRATDTLYTLPRIQKKRSKVVTLKINIQSNNLRDIHLLLSPNGKYLFACYTVMFGYVYKTEQDSVFHEVHECSFISTESGVVLKNGLSNDECTGKWNLKNQWIAVFGRDSVLIDPKKLKR